MTTGSIQQPFRLSATQGIQQAAGARPRQAHTAPLAPTVPCGRTFPLRSRPWHAARKPAQRHYGGLCALSNNGHWRRWSLCALRVVLPLVRASGHNVTGWPVTQDVSRDHPVKFGPLVGPRTIARVPAPRCAREPSQSSDSPESHPSALPGNSTAPPMPRSSGACPEAGRSGSARLPCTEHAAA